MAIERLPSVGSPRGMQEPLTPKVSSPSATVTLLLRAFGPSENWPGRLSIEGDSCASSVSEGVDCWVGEEYCLFVSDRIEMR